MRHVFIHRLPSDICSLTVTLLLHEIIYLSLFISAEHGTLYFETSAKTGFGIEEAFDAIAVATQEKMMARARELKCERLEIDDGRLLRP